MSSEKFAHNESNEEWNVWAKYVLKTIESSTEAVKLIEKAIVALNIQINEATNESNNNKHLLEKIEKDIGDKIKQIDSEISQLKTDFVKIQPRMKEYVNKKYSSAAWGASGGGVLFLALTIIKMLIEKLPK